MSYSGEALVRDNASSRGLMIGMGGAVVRSAVNQQMEPWGPGFDSQAVPQFSVVLGALQPVAPRVRIGAPSNPVSKERT